MLELGAPHRCFGFESVTYVLVKVYHLANTLTLRLLHAPGGAVFRPSAVQLVSSRAEAALPGAMPPRMDPAARAGGARARPRAQCTFDLRLQVRLIECTTMLPLSLITQTMV